MTRRENTEISFIVHGFMMRRLGLRMNELCIFAIIYSFTNGSGGFYFGTQGYLAEVCCSSLSTVKRALDGLLKKGYIERCEIDGRSGYRSTVFESDLGAIPTPPSIDETNRDAAAKRNSGAQSAANAQKAQSFASCEPSARSKKPTVHSACEKGLGEVISAYGYDEEFEDFEEFDEDDLYPTPLSKLPPPHVVEDRELNIVELLGRGAAPPKFEFYQFGRKGFVTMTAGQYRKLLKLVREEQLNAYILRLEQLMTDKGYRTFSPYKTLKKWITEDTAE